MCMHVSVCCMCCGCVYCVSVGVFMHVFVPESLCVYMCLCVYPCVLACLHPCECVSVVVCLCVYISLCVCWSVRVCLCVSSFMYTSNCVCACACVSLQVCHSVSLCVFVWVSVCWNEVTVRKTLRYYQGQCHPSYSKRGTSSRDMEKHPPGHREQKSRLDLGLRMNFAHLKLTG